MFCSADPQQGSFEFLLVRGDAYKTFGAAPREDFIYRSIGWGANMDLGHASSEQHRNDASDGVGLARARWTLNQLYLLLRHVQNSFQYFHLALIELVFMCGDKIIHLTLS
jgi:hypothetical protein